MSRPRRLVLPGIPHHVTHRGTRRERIFFTADDHLLYLRLLRRGCRRTGTRIWAWCLMPNHVHLVLVPEREDGLRAMLAPAHRLYAQEINRRQGWSGHLWDGPFRSVPMDEVHLHVCLRYVELNPVRARLAARAEAWRWSSARCHLGLEDDGLTELEPARERIDDWRALLDAGLTEDERESIRAAERIGRFVPR